MADASSSVPPSPALPLRDPLAVMRHEMRLHEGAVPDAIAGVEVGANSQHLVADEYLLREQGFACHYRQGHGVTCHLADPGAWLRMGLFLAGSVYAAVASINGFYPLHASAVALRGRVVAFTGPSGAGKSTMVAALNRCGVALFGDDTLVLDLSCKPPLALPGHKRLKLWPDAVALAGAVPQEQVSPDYPKHYVRANGSDLQAPLPLGAIVALAQGEQLAFEELRGGARLAALDETHYTEQLYRQAHGEDAAATFARRAALAQAVPHYRLSRPFAPEGFAAMLDFVLEQLERLAAPWP